MVAVIIITAIAKMLIAHLMAAIAVSLASTQAIFTDVVFMTNVKAAKENNTRIFTRLLIHHHYKW